MRIGLITGEYPPQPGGVGDFTRQLALALVAAGHDVRVLTARTALPDPQPDPGVQVHRGPARWGWRSLWAARRWAAREAVDVVNLQYQAAMYRLAAPIHFLPTLLGRPCVVTFHDLRIPYLFPKAGALRHAAVTGLARAACAAITTDPADAETLARRGVSGVTQIPIGSNIRAQPPVGFDRTAWRRTRGYGPEDFVVGYFGFLNQSKGGDTLIDALQRLVGLGAPARVLLVGGAAGASDPTDQLFGRQLEARIAALGLADRVARTGFLPEAEASAALLACDALALPYRDGASLRRGTLMAALAHGLPIVSTQGADTSSDLADGCVLALVPADSPDALAQALEGLRRDPERRVRLGSAARELARSFEWDAIAARTAVVLGGCLPQ